VLDDDSAKLVDTPNDDVFAVQNGQASLANEHYVSRVTGFETVLALAIEGGHDIAMLRDSGGDDELFADGDQAVVAGDGYVYRAKHFEDVVLEASGGYNTATVFDTTGADEFDAHPGDVTMRSEGRSVRLINVDEVRAVSSSGGRDVARLYDSTADDEYSTSPRESVMQGVDYRHVARDFAITRAYATGGDDAAEVIDAQGTAEDYVRLAWLYDFDQLAERDSDDDQSTPYETAVDEVMQFYWR